MRTRLVYGAGFALATWVAGWGLLAPGQIDRAVPWALPPIHARFVGAIYLSGAVCLLGMLVAQKRSRPWSQQSIVAPMIAIWTGVLLVVLLWRFDTIGEVRATVVVWLVAYAVLPVTEALRVWRHRADARPAPEPALPTWLRRVLYAHGVGLTVAASAMLLAPGQVAAGWPWPASDLAVQVYGGPLLAYGVGAILGARRPFDDLVILLPALAVLSAAAAVVVLAHLNTLRADPPTWLWLGGFAAAFVLYAGPAARVLLRTRVAPS